MSGGAWAAEARRSAGPITILLSVAALGLPIAIRLLAGPHILMSGADALVAVPSASGQAHLDTHFLEPFVAVTASVPLLILETDLGDRSRELLLACPVKSEILAFSRITVALAWAAFWLALDLLSNRVMGVPLPAWRDGALLLPEAAFVIAGTFAVAEWGRDVAAGAAFAFAALLLGYGIPQLPFAHPAATHLELIDARENALTAALWANRLVLVSLAVGLAFLGTVGLKHHRRKGHHVRGH